MVKNTKLIIPDDLQIHEVKLPGKGINLSTPTAKDGLEAVRYFVETRENLISQGVPADEAKKTAFYDSRIRFGAEELIRSIMLCAGQENFHRAIEQGKLFRVRGTEYARAETYEEVEHLEDEK